MKVGQVLSTVDFDLVPEGERERFKERLAALRDDVPAADFEQVRRVVEADLGAPLSEAFADFSAAPVAAASIGQVHRARTHDGRDVAVKVQYPGIAEAVETDLRNLNLLFPLVKRLAPGLDVKAIARELRDRIGEELDYEIEAQHQRTVARAFRNHPFVRIPEVDTRRSTRRVLVSEFVDGRGLRRGQGQARGPARSLRRDHVPLLLRAPRPRAPLRGRPAPGQLPPVRGRPRLLPGLRPDAQGRRGLPRGRARAGPGGHRARCRGGPPRPGAARVPAGPGLVRARAASSSSCARRASGTSSRASAAWTPSTCATRWRSAARRGRPTSPRCAARRCRPRRCSSAAWRVCSSASWASCGPAPTGARWRQEYIAGAPPITPLGREEAAHHEARAA